MTVLLSKYLRVATEGPTIDGRNITATQIDQMAANYSPEKYGARIWLEHFRSILPESIFKALGDVKFVKTGTNSQGKKTLLARLSPTADLVKMNKDRQKVYSSIEMDPDFAGTGEAYLVGLAVTDTPASTGTEMIQLSQQNSDNFSDADKITKNTFSAYSEVENLEFEESTDEPEKPSLMTRVKSILEKNQNTGDERFADVDQAVTAIAESQDGAQTQLTELQSQITTLSSNVSHLTKELKTTVDVLAKKPAGSYTPRPQNAGDSNDELAEC